jgi:hypothetical protein
MFDVEDVHHMDHNGLRHRLMRIERGRIDHLALNVTDPEEFDRLSSRLVAGGPSDGTRTDFGVLVSVSFTDPDGHFGELCWMQHTASLAGARDPA